MSTATKNRKGRLMSFALTTQQILDRTKTVTRRLGWATMKPGDRFWSVKKAMGLRPGEKVERLALLECVSNTPTVLKSITKAEVEREGFPGMTPDEFVGMFQRHMKCESTQQVNRIEFRYVEE